MQILACIPMSLMPDNPGINNPENSVYEESTCDLCGQGCWLGMRGKALVDAKVAKKVCMLCVAKKIPNADRLKVRPLTKEDA